MANLRNLLVWALLVMSLAGLANAKTWTVTWKRYIPTTNTTFTAKVGDTVQWIWSDSKPHTVTAVLFFGYSIWNPQPSGKGTMLWLTSAPFTYKYTFKNKGRFGYHCLIHTEMTGTITVT
eukprot:TRINITY_DN68_c0_g1_i2.p1 TRINITY_DN68_c0_g1~~TRINITY_DN68_c0_g1_i2.p1  ORF type:complete len:141 (-),score=0.87 TRINITY_DN68_c0_g1_i2:252-611(-)